jgi:hypothetical protein
MTRLSTDTAPAAPGITRKRITVTIDLIFIDYFPLDSICCSEEAPPPDSRIAALGISRYGFASY